DYYWPKRVVEAVEMYQLAGLVGNKRRVARQPSWAYVDDSLTYDSPDNLSGIMAHGSFFPPSNINFYGRSCQQAKLLDGLMLISKSITFHDNAFRFDEQFDFHFYDLDICRQAECKNVSMGTWPIAVIHDSASRGAYQSIEWKRNYEKYIQKWNN
ncbi:MAG: hypothetical protein Q7T80_06860, partial [Methanoregula sp.]|nr:hypothetical protein [Methanoregula sp.]